MPGDSVAGTIADIASPVQPGPPAYLPALTGMRFVLALWVVLHHISGQGMMLGAFADSLPNAGRVLVRNGYLAVQTFFVLSGFVLAQNYAGTKWNGKSLRNYFAARFARIYPVYLFSLVVVSPFIREAMARPTRTAERKLSLLTDYIFLLQGWKGDLGVGWNTPAWTLSCEFFFYLFFPLLLPLIGGAGKWLLPLLVAIAIVIPPALPHYGVPWAWKPVYYISDFAIGIAASRIFDMSKARWQGSGAWLYLPATIAGIALIIHPQTMEGTFGDLQTGLRPLNLAALVGLALGGGAIARWLSTNTMDFLGKASYSLYILHVPILWWFPKSKLHHNLYLPRIGASLLFIVVAVAISCLVFKWIEAPANKRVRRALS